MLDTNTVVAVTVPTLAVLIGILVNNKAQDRSVETLRAETAKLGSDLRLELNQLGSDLRLELNQMETRLTKEIRSVVETHEADYHGRVVRS